MTNEKNKLNHYAMEYGLLLAAYFIVKFGVSVLSTQIITINILVFILSLGVPFLLYWIISRYRDRYNNGTIDFGQAWRLSLLVIFFASLPEALAQFAYFHFIDPMYIENQINGLQEQFQVLNKDLNNPKLSELIGKTGEMKIPSAIQMVFQGIFNNLFFGSIVSLIVAAIVKRTVPRT